MALLKKLAKYHYKKNHMCKRKYKWDRGSFVLQLTQCLLQALMEERQHV